MIRYLRLYRHGRLTLEQLRAIDTGVHARSVLKKIRSTRDTKLIKVREMLDLWDTEHSYDNVLHGWCGFNTRAKVLL